MSMTTSDGDKTQVPLPTRKTQLASVRSEERARFGDFSDAMARGETRGGGFLEAMRDDGEGRESCGEAWRAMVSGRVG